jgi:hypothetical protein
VILRLEADDDFHIPVEQGNEVQQALGREAGGFEIAQFRHVRLRDAEDSGNAPLLLLEAVIGEL